MKQKRNHIPYRKGGIKYTVGQWVRDLARMNNPPPGSGAVDEFRRMLEQAHPTATDNADLLSGPTAIYDTELAKWVNIISINDFFAHAQLEHE